MKRISLVRHGKSSWKHFGLADFDRPLNGRGKKNVPEMAQRYCRFLEVNDIPKPELIVTSSANRALTTANLLCEGLGISIEKLQLSEKLYHASIEEIEYVISNLPEIHSHVAMVGHNPGFTCFGNQYSEPNIENIPTAGIVCIEFNVEHWLDVPGRQGKRLWFDYPKNKQYE